MICFKQPIMIAFPLCNQKWLQNNKTYEGAKDNVKEDALLEFQEHCNEFVKKQNGRLDSYCVDYKNVVLL